MTWDYITLLSALQPTYAVLIGITLITLDLIAIVAIVLGKGSTRHKLVWNVAILLLPLIGVVCYLLFGKSAADRSLLN